MPNSSSVKTSAGSIAVPAVAGRCARLVPIALGRGWEAYVCVGDSCDHADVADWRKWLSTLVNRSGNLPERVVLKDSKTAMVVRSRVPLSSGAIEVVCKHGSPCGTLERWVGRVRGSRAVRHWRRACALLEGGIDTAWPLALVERRGSVPEAWMVTESIPDVMDLDGVLCWHMYDLEAARARSVKRAIMERLVELCVGMRDAGIEHRDFKASNVLISDWRGEGDGVRLWLVDLDGISIVGSRDRVDGWRSIVRLGASLVDARSVTRGDAVRFLQSYLSAIGRSGEDWRDRWRALSRSIARYNRRSRLRKRGKLDGFDA